MSKCPCYCITRNSTYWFNYRLPCSQGMLRFSLRTKDKPQAYALAQHLSFKIKRASSHMTYTRDQLTVLAKQWANQWFDAIVSLSATSGPMSPEEAQSYQSNVGNMLAECKQAYSQNDVSHRKVSAQVLLDADAEGKAPDAKLVYDERHLNYLSLEITKQSINVLEAEYAKLTQGVPMPDKLHDLESLTVQVPQATTPSLPSVPMSVVFAEYSTEKTASGDWGSERTGTEFKQAVTIFIELMGDLDVTQLDKKTAREFKEKLLRYPKDRSKLKALRGLPINEIMDGQLQYTCISRSTASKRWDMIVSILNMAKSVGHITSNHLSGMPIKVSDDKKDKRHPFTEGDIMTIFSQPMFTQGKRLRDHYYWLPLLGLYTGARIEELCQLNLKDIAEVDEVLCCNITDEGEGQRLKSKASKRRIPIHPHLVELGFIQYVDARKATGDTMLFPAMKKQSGRFSHGPSKWFSGVKTKLGFEQDKAFHSFRHTFIDKLRAIQAPDYIIKGLAGHSDESMTHSVYGSNSPVPLLPIVEQIDWSNELSGVKPFDVVE